MSTKKIIFVVISQSQVDIKWSQSDSEDVGNDNKPLSSTSACQLPSMLYRSTQKMKSKAMPTSAAAALFKGYKDHLNDLKVKNLKSNI